MSALPAYGRANTTNKRPTPRAGKKVPAKPAQMNSAPVMPARTDVSLQPEVFASWLMAADAIKDDPPYLRFTVPTKEWQIGPCHAGASPGSQGSLNRKCYTSDVIAAPDSRLQKTATVDNRVALVRHYVDRFALPPVGRAMDITPAWFFRKSSPQAPGVDDLNSIAGMIRVQLMLTQEAIIADAKNREEAIKSHLPATFLGSMRMTATSMLQGIDRERRLVDFWFPDAPAWTALMNAACSSPANQLPYSRCCFRKLDGCLERRK